VQQFSPRYGSDAECAQAELEAWALVSAAAEAAGTVDTASAGRFAFAAGRLIRLGREESGAALQWNPAEGWEACVAADDARRDLLDLYLPISSATAERPLTIGHLGQSLDGFIATAAGDSFTVTGPENILHLHRLRALCDAIIVGAGTVAADNPRLTTRLVPGRNPVRVILDPECRLPDDRRVFSDGAALTLRACLAGAGPGAARRAQVGNILEVPACGRALDLGNLLRQLRSRGYRRIFVEGGGVTVSSFLDAGLLDRLHLAVAPLLIGDGRPAVRMPAQARLRDCLRFRHRVFRAGDDILFDCDLRAGPHGGAHSPAGYAAVRRVL